MKTNIFMLAGAAIVAGVALVSCDKTPQITGSWTGNPQNLSHVNGAFTASSIDVLNFTQNDDKRGGSIVVNSMLSAQQTVSSPTPDFVEPYQETIAGTASINGNWSFRPDDNDEIDIVFDYSTLDVNVDPSGVVFSQNFITGREQPQVDSLTASAVERWKQSLKESLRTYYGRYVRLDDIEVHGNVLRLEANDVDLSFARESE